ncbi:MAG TPA: beta/gamma crystallin-related protein, partial [Edaphobacter sp.]
SSLQPVSATPTAHGAPIDGHVVLFENANFHGAHKHVFTKEPNLNASDDNFFNDRVSSVAALRAVWAFFKNANYNVKYPPLLGPTIRVNGAYPGLYPFVANIGIQNDDMSSLEPVAGGASIAGISQPEGQVVLFENAGFHGQHKHVYTLEGNLNASDDHFFNDRVSSIVVQQSVWAFYRNSGMNGQYPRTLGPGLYSYVVDYGIQNDDMSSLQPL